MAPDADLVGADRWRPGSDPVREQLDELLRPRARRRDGPLGPGGGDRQWWRSPAAVAVAVVVAVGGFLGYRAATSQPVAVELPMAASPDAPGAGSDAAAGTGPGAGRGPGSGSGTDADPSTSRSSAPTHVVVQVGGAVLHPGVVELPAGARWNDAVAAAGGPRLDADLDRVNLAAPVTDGARLFVPQVGVDPPVEVAASGAPSGVSGAEGEPDGPATPLDLNSATADELDALPGVGPTTAAAILEYRRRHGAFGSVDELDEVGGIGPSRLERLRPLVRVDA